MMLLKVKGLKATGLTVHEVVEGPFDEELEDPKPKHLIPLGDVLWPESVKAEIAAQFKAIGVQDPYRQKLVEPFARVFGGRNNDGSYELSGVDWEMVIDYFRWEAACWGNDSPAKEKALDLMIAEIKAKYGGMFNHQMVYSKGRDWR